MRIEPCAPLQERMWFLHQLIPASGPAFNVSTATRLRGPIDVPALNAALTGLAQRHESLRTTFAIVDGRPMRQVADSGTWAVLERATDPDQLAATIEAEAMARFDLGAAPPRQATLLRLGADDAVFVLCLSHAIADGWSMGILHRELGELYLKGPDLPEITYSFSDWFHGSAARADSRREAELTHWRSELDGAPAALDLPTDHPRPAAESYAGHRQGIELAADLAAMLAERARELKVTPFAIHLAAYALALRESDVVIGIPWANRRTVDQESVVGPLMDLLPIRLRVSAESTLESLAAAVRQRTIRAMANSAVGFDAIVAALRPAREAGRHPLFQAMFLMQNAPLEPVSLLGCLSEAVPVMPPTARLDVALDISDFGGRVHATFELNRDLFDPGMAGYLALRYEHVLRQILVSPRQPVSALSLVPSAERVPSVGPHVLWDGPDLLHALVDRAALADPEAVAVECLGESVTYAKLVSQSTDAAHRLRAAGVRPGDVVGIQMHRSIEMITAMLAVMRCAAAYLPMDPEYPPARLAEIAADAGVALVLTDLGQLPPLAGSGHPVGDSSGSRAAADARGLPCVDPCDIAYVIYTSGSTGRPKGVMVSHGSVCNIIHWGQREMPLTGADRMLGKTPFTFDISVWEFFGTLAAGATLVLAAPGRHRDASYVARMLAEAGITVTHFVPSMLRGVLTLPFLPAWPRLRLVIAGGEALPADLAARCPAPVVNFYGPTEAVVYVSHHLAGDRVAMNGTVPIGRPVANVAMYVLDEQWQPVPYGARGELYVGGVQVAAGYLGRSGLTATRFLPDPFSGVPGARMYRTGDTVRRASDGTMDFLGRGDGQVKLRGFRIELGEIEAALMAHPGVTMAAASVRGDTLVAHVIPQMDSAELRSHLSARLPGYMVPGRFGYPERLTLTTSGKLDRGLLASLPLEEAAPVAAAPLEPREALLADVWSALLGQPVADPDANFFALGGDSITSVAIVAESARRGLHVTVQQVFEQPTLAALARAARPLPAEPAVAGQVSPAGLSPSAGSGIAAGSSAVAGLAVAGEAPPAGLASAGFMTGSGLLAGASAALPAPAGRLEVRAGVEAAVRRRFPDAEAVLPLGPMQSFAVPRVRRMRMPGLYVVCFTATIDGQRFDVEAWRWTWQELMARHPGLRTSFWPVGEEDAVAVVHRDLRLPFEVTDATEQAVRDAETQERWHVIDVSDAPQWRMRVFRVGDDSWRVICRLSYLLQDGWSVSVLQNEWYPLYDAYRRGADPLLPPMPPSYETQLGHLARRDPRSGLDYWAARITAARDAPAVRGALQRRCRAGQGPEHQTVPRWLTAADEAATRDFARRERVALFAPLQGAWALLLAGLTGERDVLFGTISSGRATPDVTRTYGSFNNMMPTQVRVDPGEEIGAFLRRLQAAGVTDRDNDHVPLPLIAAAAGIDDAVNLVDTYIVHENFPIDRATQDRFAQWRPDIAEMRTEHALRMLIWPVGELSFHLSFDARLLSEADGQVLMDAYVDLLIAMAAGEHGTLAGLIRDPFETSGSTPQ